jgi:hypothetical protein
MALRGDQKGFYRELGVHRTASAHEIRQAFRERAKVLHPDQGQGGEDDSRFKRLAEAYETLKDPRRRLQYDAEGLAAERDQERYQPEPRREVEEGIVRRGERPHRVTPVRQPADGFWPRPLWLGALAGCFALACVLALLWWQGRSVVAARDAQIGDLAQRYNALLRTEQELRARYRAQGAAAAEQLPGGEGGAAAAAQTLFSQEIPFQIGSVEVDAPLEATIDGAVVDLSRALRQVPENQDWVVVVDGYAGRAAAETGVAVDAWETSLLRIGNVLDRLVQQGLPTDRIAARFQAGFAAGIEADTPVVELKLVCCFR